MNPVLYFFKKRKGYMFMALLLFILVLVSVPQLDQARRDLIPALVLMLPLAAGTMILLIAVEDRYTPSVHPPPDRTGVGSVNFLLTRTLKSRKSFIFLLNTAFSPLLITAPGLEAVRAELLYSAWIALFLLTLVLIGANYYESNSPIDVIPHNLDAGTPADSQPRYFTEEEQVHQI